VTNLPPRAKTPIYEFLNNWFATLLVLEILQDLNINSGGLCIKILDSAELDVHFSLLFVRH